MIGERLAEVRKDHGDRQDDFAKKLHVSISTVRSWEQEKSSPPEEMLVAICRLYNVTSDFLLGLSDEDPLWAGRRYERFTTEERVEIRCFEDYLLWKRKK